MKTRIMVGVVVMLFFGTLGNAQVAKPVAVSPGGDTGVAVVGLNCPTFSWSAVTGAPSYRIEVFQAIGAAILSYEEMARQGTMVLQKEIPGAATSWTPSWEEQLNAGVEYAWYVGAADTLGNIIWSKGKVFRVDPTVGVTAVVEKAKEKLKALGLSEEAASAVFAEDRTEVVKRLASGFSLAPQGLEGDSNTFYGLNAGAYNTTGDKNTFVGWAGGFFNTTGYRNTFLGWAVGYSNTSGSYNTFVGWGAGNENSTTHYNTFLGYGAGFSNKASYNTYVGYGAGFYNTTGQYNLFAGWGAGYANNTGISNTFLGGNAGAANTNGYYNTFVGQGAGYSNISGNDNTFIGQSAGYTNKSYGNTFIGKEAGYQHDSGQYNTFIGYRTGRGSSSLVYSTYVGAWAGYNSQSGSGNVFLGYCAGYNETGTHKLYIEASSSDTPLIYGDFVNNYLTFHGSIGVAGAHTPRPAPTHLIDVSGGAYCTGSTWVNGSSRELKENIENLTASQAFTAFQELVPTKFNYKDDKEDTCLGFIAEDVPELVATKDRKGLSPMDIVAVLTKVVQEQQKTVAVQQKMIAELNNRIVTLEKKR